MKTTVIEWRQLLLNEDDSYWIKKTFVQWRWLLLNAEHFNDWRRLLMHEDDCYSMVMSVRDTERLTLRDWHWDTDTETLTLRHWH